MTLKIKKLHADAIVPQYAHPTDSGMDLRAIADDVILGRQNVNVFADDTSKTKNWKLIKTGIAIELEPHTEAQVRSRSGLALKNGISVKNSPGTIDFSYRGEIGVILINDSLEDFVISKGMKIAQMVIMPVLHPEIEVVEELSTTIRSAGGFGSTGV